KQRLRKMVGIMEAQMVRYYKEANRLPGRTGESMLRLLEMRLDSVVKKAGWATSPRFARQLVSHGHVSVNGRRVKSPSFIVSKGDRIEMKAALKDNFYVNLAKQGFERRGAALPSWMTAGDNGAVLIARAPEASEFTFPISDQYVVEFYSKR
ncbi:MAG: 30S ribosomal protein S4, partial [Elusimicrobiota bacterium]